MAYVVPPAAGLMLAGHHRGDVGYGLTLWALVLDRPVGTGPDTASSPSPPTRTRIRTSSRCWPTCSTTEPCPSSRRPPTLNSPRTAWRPRSVPPTSAAPPRHLDG